MCSSFRLEAERTSRGSLGGSKRPFRRYGDSRKVKGSGETSFCKPVLKDKSSVKRGRPSPGLSFPVRRKVFPGRGLVLQREGKWETGKKDTSTKIRKGPENSESPSVPFRVFGEGYKKKPQMDLAQNKRIYTLMGKYKRGRKMKLHFGGRGYILHGK